MRPAAPLSTDVAKLQRNYGPLRRITAEQFLDEVVRPPDNPMILGQDLADTARSAARSAKARCAAANRANGTR